MRLMLRDERAGRKDRRVYDTRGRPDQRERCRASVDFYILPGAGGIT